MIAWKLTRSRNYCHIFALSFHHTQNHFYDLDICTPFSSWKIHQWEPLHVQPIFCFVVLLFSGLTTDKTSLLPLKNWDHRQVTLLRRRLPAHSWKTNIYENNWNEKFRGWLCILVQNPFFVHNLSLTKRTVVAWNFLFYIQNMHGIWKQLCANRCQTVYRFVIKKTGSLQKIR